MLHSRLLTRLWPGIWIHAIFLFRNLSENVSDHLNHRLVHLKLKSVDDWEICEVKSLKVVQAVGILQVYNSFPVFVGFLTLLYNFQLAAREINEGTSHRDQGASLVCQQMTIPSFKFNSDKFLGKWQQWNCAASCTS